MISYYLRRTTQQTFSNVQQIYPNEVDATRPGGYTRQKLSPDRLLKDGPCCADFVKTTSPRGVLPAIRRHVATVTSTLPGGGTAAGEKKNKNDPKQGAIDDMVVLWGALATAEYVDVVFGGRRRRRQRGCDNNADNDNDEIILPLLPDDNNDRNAARVVVQMWSHHIVHHIYPCFERAVSEQQQQQQESLLWDVCLDECRAVAMAMSSSKFDDDEDTGPFFLGRHFSLVDVVFAPLWQRILWLHQHGTTTTHTTDDDEPAWRQRITVWWRAVAARPSVSATLVSKSRLQAFYYNNNDRGGGS